MRTRSALAFALLAAIALAAVTEPVADSNAPEQATPRLLDLQEEPMLYIVDPAIEEGVLSRG